MFSCERIDWEDAEYVKGWTDTGPVKLKGGTLEGRDISALLAN